MSATLIFHRHYCRYEEKYDTAKDAARSAYYQQQYGEMYAEAIVVGGERVWDHKTAEHGALEQLAGIDTEDNGG